MPSLFFSFLFISLSDFSSKAFLSSKVCILSIYFLYFPFPCISKVFFFERVQKLTMGIKDKICITGLIVIIIRIMSVSVKSFIFSFSASIFKLSTVVPYRVLLRVLCHPYPYVCPWGLPRSRTKSDGFLVCLQLAWFLCHVVWSCHTEECHFF